MLTKLGPLKHLAGVWEGDKGDDLAPSDTRGTEKNKYRERMTFEAFGPTNNHEQELWGLRYSTTAWRIGEPDPFHEDVGYWLWDAADKQVIKSFVIPRGIAILAGGDAEADSRVFTVAAKEGSSTYGLCHNRFLEREFRILSFELKLQMNSENSFTYEQNTRLKIKGREAIFDHRDKNTLVKIL